MRRNRRSEWARRMVRECALTTDDLIWPLFVTEGEGVEEPIGSLPGVSRWSVYLIAARAKEAAGLDIPCLALFPNTPPAKRSDDGKEALDPHNLVCRAIRAIKDACGDGVDSDCNGVDCGDSLLGPWLGVVTQNGSLDYPITAAVTSLGTGVCGTVDYPSLSCGGVWVCDVTSDGESLVATELLTYGLESCVDVVGISLTLSSIGTAHWEATAPGYFASSELSRPN